MEYDSGITLNTNINTLISGKGEKDEKKDLKNDWIGNMEKCSHSIPLFNLRGRGEKDKKGWSDKWLDGK